MMPAMILAAGEGRRMRPLTETTPKPLLKIDDLTLLEHHIINLRQAGFDQLVVNAAYLAEQIESFCGDGSRWGVSLSISRESEPLETAGGIVNAMPLLGDDPFLVVNADIWCPYPFAQLIDPALSAGLPVGGAHLVMVGNPEHNTRGDFSLQKDRLVMPAGSTLTFSGIGVYSPAMFNGLARGKRPLKPLLDEAIRYDRLRGSFWDGPWEDVGTPERLRALRERLAA